MLTFDRLQEILPENSIRFPGAILTIDIPNLVGSTPGYDASVLELYARLLEGLHSLQITINQERASVTPPLLPVQVISKSLATSEKGNPVYSYKVDFEINSSLVLDAVIDPTT